MARDVKKRGPARFTNRRNRQKYLQKKEDKKKQSKSKVAVIKENWSETKTPRENIQDMGIAFDPNEVVSIKTVRKEIIDAVPIEGEEIELPKIVKRVTRKKKNTEQANFVINQLNEQVKEEEEKVSAEGRKFKLFHRETELCVYMLARHGDDFQAMTRDPKNLWQYTPKQWARKIKAYKDSDMCKFIEST